MPYRGMGYKPSLSDIRNYKLRFATAVDLPAKVDLCDTGFVPDVWDQGGLGSCVSHGVDFAYGFDLAKQGEQRNWNGSRLFIYYNGRVRENTVSEDSGLTITDGIKALNEYGTPPAEDWPYVEPNFAVRPPEKAYNDGKLHEAVRYAEVAQTANDMRSCLAAGVPFVIGFTVYNSFESNATAANGVVRMPASGESVLGGHCIAAVGYLSGADLIAELRAKGRPVTNVYSTLVYYKMRNSWGTAWGDGGYCYMPEGYLASTRLAGDFWTVQSVSSPAPAPPIPDPVPPPVVDPDQTLWDSVKTWAHARHATTNKAAAKAVLAWAASKGFS